MLPLVKYLDPRTGYDVNRLTASHFTQYDGTVFNTNAGIDFTSNNLRYEAHGNILTMNQKGFTIGTSTPIDRLTYSYQTSSNKIAQVNDGCWQ